MHSFMVYDNTGAKEEQMKFSEFFELAHTQPSLDFIDVDNEEDIPLFFDPFVFANEDNAFSSICSTSINSFFETVLHCVRTQDHARGRHLLGNLNEPNELCLGWSKGKPRGRGIGVEQANQLYDRLAASEAAHSGLMADLSDCELFIDGIGPDKISDITANIIRGHLIEYTQAQCNLHNVPLSPVPSGPIWNERNLDWERRFVDLPVLSATPVILVPKRVVRWIGDLSHQHQKYYRHFVLNFLRDEHLRANTGLVHVLKNGTRRVYKKDLEERNPLSKDFVFRFSRENPAVLEGYKNAFRATKGVDVRDLDEDFNTELFVDSLIQALEDIPPGGDDASRFHNLIVGILEFVFYPNLYNPNKEHEIHEGRKRIDISYVNGAKDGFFFRVHTQRNISSSYIMVECKNYTGDPANPELDQLSGRFSPNRGRLGLLVARNFVNRDRFVARCRDTANDDRGIIIPLVDDDIIELLMLVRNGRRSRIDAHLENILREIIN